MQPAVEALTKSFIGIPASTSAIVAAFMHAHMLPIMTIKHHSTCSCDAWADILYSQNFHLEKTFASLPPTLICELFTFTPRACARGNWSCRCHCCCHHSQRNRQILIEIQAPEQLILKYNKLVEVGLQYAQNRVAWPITFTNSVFIVGHRSHAHRLHPLCICIVLSAHVHDWPRTCR